MESIHELFAIKNFFSGQGINHEKQEFTGHLELSPIEGNRGSLLRFKAIGRDGTIFHEESSLIGIGLDGLPCLHVLSNNHPGIISHTISRSAQTDQGKEFVFSFGDLTNANSFREEIVLTIRTDKTIEYKYFWGIPGGQFAERSGAIMSTVKQ